MPDSPKNTPAAGSVSWFDLTIDDAEQVRDFYEKVAGWKSTPVEMGGYNDHCMIASDGTTVGGVCHAKGSNAGIPPAWMIYIQVDDIETTIENCKANGGEVIQAPRQAGGGTMAILKDPAGACFGIYSSSPS